MNLSNEVRKVKIEVREVNFTKYCYFKEAFLCPTFVNYNYCKI